MEFTGYVSYLQENYIYLIFVLFIYLLSNLLTYFLLHRVKFNFKGNIRNGDRVMFVISHPDDECMFFGPSIIKFVKQNNCNVFLLCLSNGDYYQQGNIRKQELWDSCSALGIPSSNVILYTVSVLPDNPNVKWDESVLGNIIFSHVEQLRINTLCTFDKDGISSHLNHVGIYYGIAKKCVKGLIPKYCKVYCLDTVNICRKYSFILDILHTICFSSNWVISSIEEFQILRTAMAAHRSQYIWFRKLYMHFSRYTFINTYTQLAKQDVEFDMLFKID